MQALLLGQCFMHARYQQGHRPGVRHRWGVSEDLPFLDLELAGLAALVLPCLTQ